MLAVTRVHAFTDDALGTLDAVGLAEEIAARRVSIVEVVDAALARVAAVNDRLNAVAFLDPDRARAEARAPRGGFFAGVPTFVKDNVDVEGMPTQHGADAWHPRPRPVNGDFARMYLATGVLPLGKTRLSEFGFSPSAEHPRLGPVRCPWDPDHTAGASSAGSGALVAAGAVPIAHANDGGGSIRIPASVNGLVGLKPTRGRLAQDAMMRRMPVRIVVDGVVTRTVRDTAAFLREAEKVYRNHALPPVGDVSRPGRARLDVAMLTQGLGVGASPEVRELTVKTANLLEELGHRVTEIANPEPDQLADDFLTYWSFLAFALVTGGRRTYGRSWDAGSLDPFTLGLVERGRRSLHRLPTAITRLQASARRARRRFREWDVVLTPTLATQTPTVGTLDPGRGFDAVLEGVLEWVAFTPLENANGTPAISLPLATTAAGLPQGMMFAAGVGREATLLQLAYELEEAAPFASLATPVEGSADPISGGDRPIS